MANDVGGERIQPAPATEYSLLGEAEPTALDWERIWWHVPGARRARAVLLPLLALTVLSGLLLAPIPELSWAVSIVPPLLVLGPYLALSAGRGGFARRQLMRFGAGPIAYRLDSWGVEISATRVQQRCSWEDLRGFLDAPEAFVIYPARGAPMLLPKRAFDVGAAHLRWLLGRRSPEHRAPRWGLRLAVGTLSFMMFLAAWHFWRIREMQQAGPRPEQEPSGGRQ